MDASPLKMIPENSIGKTERWIALLALMLPYMGAFLYFVGSIFAEGYFRYWHLHSGIFDWPINLVLLESVKALITLGISKGIASVLAILFVFVCLYVLHLAYSSVYDSQIGRLLRLRKLKKARKTRSKKRVKMHFHLPLMVTAVGFMFLYLFTALTLFFGIFGSGIERLGFKAAHQRHLSINPTGSRDQISRTMLVGIGASASPNVRGEVVSCVSQKCVLLDGDIIYLVDFDSSHVQSASTTADARR